VTGRGDVDQPGDGEQGSTRDPGQPGWAALPDHPIASDGTGVAPPGAAEADPRLEPLRQNAEQLRRSAIGLGIALGAGIGTALGVATGNVTTWLPVGIGVGLAIGSGIAASRRGG